MSNERGRLDGWTDARRKLVLHRARTASQLTKNYEFDLDGPKKKRRGGGVGVPPDYATCITLFTLRMAASKELHDRTSLCSPRGETLIGSLDLICINPSDRRQGMLT